MAILNVGASAKYKTIDQAHRDAKYGDTISVAPGVYKHATINKDGITLIGNKAVISDAGYEFGILVTGHHVKVSGFEVKGAKVGIHVRETHNVEVSDNYSHHNSNHGIYSFKSNFLNVHNNEVAYNGGTKGSSGISIHAPSKIGTGTAHHQIKVVDNHTHHNKMTGKGTEGWGIIIDEPDVFRASQIAAGWKDYFEPILVKGNTAHDNGRYGILVFHAKNVDVVDNLSYHNSKDSSVAAGVEIGFTAASNIKVTGNVAIGDGTVGTTGTKDAAFLMSKSSSGFTMKDNLTWIEDHPELDGLRSTSSKIAWSPTLNDYGVEPDFDYLGVQASELDW